MASRYRSYKEVHAACRKVQVFCVSVVREDLLMLKGLKKLPAAVELSMLNIKQMVDFDTWVKVG
eukprot:scaffold6280_cov127-Skeletonema_marinoi.AAC.7